MVDQAEFERRLPALLRQPAAGDEAPPILAGVRQRIARARLMRAIVLSGSLAVGLATALAAALAVRPGLRAPADLWARAATAPAALGFDIGLAGLAPAGLSVEPGVALLALAAFVLIALAGLNTLRDA